MSILIVGAGPAGSHLAYNLAKNGIDITLVDRLIEPSKNAFSSAALPQSALEMLDIPKDSISTYWNSWCIIDQDRNQYKWTSKNKLGAILDFGQLRKSLWMRAQKAGANLLAGHLVKNVVSNSKFAEIDLVTSAGEHRKEIASLVIDATGFRRTFLNTNNSLKGLNKTIFLNGSGIEWIIQTDPKSAMKWQNQVTFFLGTRWIEYGYGWIFRFFTNSP